MVVNSMWKDNFQTLEPYWERKWGILGDGGIIFPFVGPGDDGQPNAATFKSRQSHSDGIEAVVTWSSAPSAWANALDLTNPDHWKNIVPILQPDGSADCGTTPDNAAYNFDDSGSNPMSTGTWIKISGAESGQLLSKRASGANQWSFAVAGGKPQLWFYDQSAGAQTYRTADTAITVDVWHHIVATYDSTGGATASNGTTIYVDGASVASTATNSGSYVAMEDTASVLAILAEAGTGSFFDGMIAGGPLGPFICSLELTAAQVKRIYFMERAALGLV